MSDMAFKLWLNTEIGKHAKNYIDAGFAIFPCYGTKVDLSCTCNDTACKNIGKHPYTKRGLLDATKDLEVAGELFAHRDDLNIAIVCGKISGMFIIDIDVDKGGEVSLQKLEEEIGELPPCPTVHTGGGGRHLVFAYPEQKIKSRANAFGKDYLGIDIRNDGSYVVWPPSLHKSGKRYEFAPESFEIDFPQLPDAWVELSKDKPKVEKPTDRSISSGAISEWSETEVWRMLDVLNPDMFYDEWIAVGMALHREGFQLSMWDQWSRRGQKYQPNCCDSHWRSFNKNGERTIGTIVEWASLQGWKPLEYNPLPIDTSSVDAFARKLQEKASQKKPKEIKAASVEKPPAINGAQVLMIKEEKKGGTVYIPRFSFDPCALPGALGDTVRWINKHALFEQPELALINVIAFAGAVFGRRYASPVKTRTNLYMVGVARTGAGKDHSRQMVNLLALQSGLSNHIGGNAIRSDTGMLRGLMNNSSQILQLDEFGLLMQALSDPRAPHHVRMISKALMSLYSDSKGAYHHGDYADEKAKPIKIIHPNLCIYGTTTEASYVPALRKSAIESGELNRFIVIPSRFDAIPKRDIPADSTDEEVFDWWRQFTPGSKSSLGELVNNASIAPKPKIVGWGECEAMQYDLLLEQTRLSTENTPTKDLWSRMYENTIKVAMIFSIARDPKNPVFTKEDFDNANNIVRISIEYMSALAENSMVETLQEANHIEVMKFIMHKPTGIDRSQLLRKFRKFKKKEIDELVNGMMEEGIVVADRMINGSGRPTILYRYVHEEKEAIGSSA